MNGFCLQRLVGACALASASAWCGANTGADLALCTQAVSQANTYLEARQHIAEQRVEAGDLSAAALAVIAQQITEQAQTLTVAQCMAALNTPAHSAFYHCLVEHGGHLARCSL